MNRAEMNDNLRYHTKLSRKRFTKEEDDASRPIFLRCGSARHSQDFQGQERTKT